MSKVLVTREKLDKLASIIGGKADVAVPLTIDGTIAAAETLGKGGANLQTKSVSIAPSTSAQTQTVNPDTGYDGMDQVNVNVSAVPEGEIFVDVPHISFFTDSGVQKCRIENGAGVVVGDDYGTPGYIENGTWKTRNIIKNVVPLNMHITPTESSQTVGGVEYVMAGPLYVDAIPSNYVGSGITQRTSSDVTSSGDTVTIPGGFYGSSVTKIISAVTQDNDGYLVLDDEGSGGGASGLVYETGTWTPAEDALSYTISFTNMHATAPFFYMISDTGEYYSTAYSNHNLTVWSPYILTGVPLYYSSDAAYYAIYSYKYRGTSTTSLSTSTSNINSESGISRYMTNTGIRASSPSDSLFWRADRTYKWIAVWVPTT